MLVLFLNHHALGFKQTACCFLLGWLRAMFKKAEAVVVTDCALSSQAYFQCRVAYNKAQVAGSCQCKC